MDAGHGLQEIATFWSVDDIAERLEWLEAVDELKAEQAAPRQGAGGGFPLPGYNFGR